MRMLYINTQAKVAINPFPCVFPYNWLKRSRI
uniref:Uncharacterized protein n=1 Tax=Rhizophora mucronata TaxID=61149 RepID=A0A2P2MF52_RHIMU